MVILLERFQHLASLIPRSVVGLELPFVLDIVTDPLNFPMGYALLGFGPNRAPPAIILGFN